MRKSCAARLRTVLSDSIASGRLQDDLAELTGDELEFLRFDWELWARDEQLPPLYMAPSDSPSSSRPEGAEPHSAFAHFFVEPAGRRGTT